MSCTVFVSSGYLYLRRSFKPAKGDASKIPYTFSAPENKGIMTELCSDLTFFYLDFEDEKLTVIIPPDSFSSDEIYGYPIDFKIKSDYSLLAAVIDYAGGIELSDGDTVLRYTGVQISDILSRTADISELKRDIINALIAQIAENGIDGEVFKFIIENTETDLTVPDCFNWEQYLEKLCRNGGIIN